MITTRLLAADKVLDLRFENPADWLSYDRDNTSQRYSRLNQINIGNVARLQAKWVFQTIRIPTRSEATPLVRSGIMYFTVGGAEAFALDARTGRVIWDFNYRYPDPPETQSGAPSNGPVVGANYNRGVALMGNRVFMATGDCSLIALDSRSGSLIWRTAVREPEPCFGITAAPVVFGNRVLIGVRGGDAGELRGYVDAYDAETGKRAWRFYSIPAPGEPGSETWPASDVWKTGGGPTWTSGSFDANLNLLYWTTGNAGPKDFDGTDRPGDNLYTASVLALNPSTGKLVWHYQFTPHDQWDWDANETPVLVDTDWRGRPRKLLVQANRNGFFYVLDRTNGEFLSAQPFAKQNWLKEFGPGGRPIFNLDAAPTRKGSKVCPDVHGGTNWQAPSYNPSTGLFYLTARDSCSIFFLSGPGTFDFVNRIVQFPTGPVIDTETSQPQQSLRAIDLQTGKVRWSVPFHGIAAQEITFAGTMSTAGGLVFSSSRDGQFIAADATNGKILWHFNTGGTIRASPMTYAVDGKQYVAIVTKAAVFSFGLPDE